MLRGGADDLAANMKVEDDTFANENFRYRQPVSVKVDFG
jgi:hypothetical protein